MRAAVTFEAPALEPKHFDGGPDAPELMAALVAGLRTRGLDAAVKGHTLIARADGHEIDVFAAFRGADFLVGVPKLGDDALAVRVRDALDEIVRALPDVRAVTWHEEPR